MFAFVAFVLAWIAPAAAQLTSVHVIPVAGSAPVTQLAGKANKSAFAGDGYLVAEYASVNDVHSPDGNFDTATILGDLAGIVDPAAYDFVLLYTVGQVPGFVHSGSRGKNWEAKNIGRQSGTNPQITTFSAWPRLRNAPHMNSIDFISTNGPTFRGMLPGVFTAMHEMGHAWGVGWAPTWNIVSPESWTTANPVAWLAYYPQHWSWLFAPASDAGLLKQSFAASWSFNDFDLYAMGLMGYGEVAGRTYTLREFQPPNTTHSLTISDLLYSLSLGGVDYYEGNGHRIPDTDPTMQRVRALVVVVKGQSEVITPAQHDLLAGAMAQLPQAWSMATRGRSWLTMGGSAAGFVEYPVPTINPGPVDIVTGPDGNLWFTELRGNKIGKITPAGVITEYWQSSGPVGITVGPDGNLWFTDLLSSRICKMATAGGTPAGGVSCFYLNDRNSWPASITAGPDGNVWFTEVNVNKIGKVTPAGNITEYAVPAINPVDLSSIVAGPDGNLWFTLVDSNKVGKITTAGVFTLYTVPTPNSQPSSITAGPDGNLWFIEDVGRIGRITTLGVISEYPISSPGSMEMGDISPGPDGNVWFTMSGGNKIGKITPAGVITQYPVPTAASTPFGITNGPDGNLWFTQFDGAKIGKITTAGVVTEFPLSPASAAPSAITTGADGNVWFTEDLGGKIGRLTPAGVLTEFAVPVTAGAWFLPSPTGIAAGPDGNLWFAERVGSQIGRITTAGVITMYPVLTANSMPGAIAAGPDGNLWFTEEFAGKIGRITTAGVVTEFAMTPYSQPKGIVAGSDGNLWFTLDAGNSIGRITTAGAITLYPLPDPDSAPNFGIALGPDGNVWFTEDNGNRIGRITPSGLISEYTVPTPAALQGIAAGPDGNLWFTEALGNRIGRITPAGVITEYPLPNPESGPVGITAGPGGAIWFTDAFGNRIGRLNPMAPPLLLTVAVAGGPGTVSSNPAGISCGATCTAAFDTGAIVDLLATPGNGYLFVGWSGSGCIGIGSCTVTMDAARSVTAHFNLDPAGDFDGDGIPNAVELAEGRNPLAKDNDIFSPGAASARLFAMQQYRDFLGREGDPLGIQGWADVVANGSWSRLQVIDAFLNSQEFAGFVAPVVRLYFATFLRVPDYAGLAFNAGLVRAGTITPTQLADFFTVSPEFQATYGSLNDTQFVTLLYNNVLGRAPDPAGLAGWVGLLGSGYTRGQVLIGFSDSIEYQAQMANEVFVTMMYAGMLHRTPEPLGFSGWVGFLDAGTYTREQVINGFFLSTEYHGRFLP